MTRLIFPVLLGLVGIAVLLGLGTWQVQRLQLKQATITAIDARIADAPVPLPVMADPLMDKYMAVQATGTLPGEDLIVLTSHDGTPGYRVISVLGTEGRRVLVDLGFVGLDAKDNPRAVADITIRGHLHWPDEVDGWTPAAEGRMWFARDVTAMAATLGTEPLLIVAAQMSGADLGVTPLPIDTADIPNDHLGYAITWFALALVWAIMSGFFIWRMTRAPRKV